MITASEMLSDISRLPLRVRRRALRLWWSAARTTARLPDPGVADLLTYVLHVSNSEARRIAQEIVYQDMVAGVEWGAVLKRSRTGFESDLETTFFPDREVIEQVSRDGNPVIFAPLHMGCFLLPFARIMLDHFKDRRMLILRAKEDNPQQTQAMRRLLDLGIEMRFLNVNDKSKYLDAIRFAREGAVMVSFVDLPASYGAPAPVTLFGRPIQLAMGIGGLARLTEATVIPMAVRSSVDGDVVNIGQPFQTYQKSPAEKLRIALVVQRHIEHSIRDTPEQWHMWPRFHEFLDLETRREAV
jgi:phosphatidylinositol dimannoside acyltransferase